MLYADAVRGWDATGVIGVTNRLDFGIMKEAQCSYIFLEWGYADSDLKKKMFQQGQAIIGHNRARTVGVNSDENAHPFVVDDTFAMVHNGTLRNHKQLADTVVDSEALAIVFKKAMDEEDWKTALEKALGKIEGAFAVAWYDQKRNQVCLLRNKERPLYLLESKDDILFASEPGMGLWAAGRNSTTIDKVKEVPEYTLITFDLAKGGADYTQTPLTPAKPVYKHVLGNIQRTATSTAFVKRVTGEVPKTVVSKQQYKRFCKLLLGKPVLFEQDDFVEVNLFGEEDGKYILLGESKNGAFDLMEFRHIIKTTVDLNDLGMDQKEMEAQVKWWGRVKNVEYQAKTQTIEVVLDEVKPCAAPAALH